MILPLETPRTPNKSASREQSALGNIWNDHIYILRWNLNIKEFVSRKNDVKLSSTFHR